MSEYPGYHTLSRFDQLKILKVFRELPHSYAQLFGFGATPRGRLQTAILSKLVSGFHEIASI